MESILPKIIDDIGTIISILVGIIALISISIYAWRYLKSQFKFIKNLKRKIYFLKTSNVLNLQAEKGYIKKVGLFNIDDQIKDVSNDYNFRTLQSLKSNAVYIVGYDKNYQSYKSLLRKAESSNIPILILSKPNEVTAEHFEFFNSYIYCDVANTTNRLVVMLLNMLKIV